MKSKFFCYSLYICLLFVVSVGVHNLCHNDDNGIAYVSVTDTIYSVKHDTVFVEKPRYVTRKIVDTVFVESAKGDSVAIPIEQRYYNAQKFYDVWVSGYRVQLDSIKVYPRIEKHYITTEKTKVVYDNKPKLYVLGGLQALQGDIIPKISISLQTKNKWLITPEFGIYQNKPTYGINIGKQIK